RRAAVAEDELALGEAGVAVAAGHDPRRAHADAAVAVRQHGLDADGFAGERAQRSRLLRLAARRREAPALLGVVALAGLRGRRAHDVADVEQRRFALEVVALHEQVAAPDHVLEPADAVRGHQLAQLLRHVLQEPRRVPALAAEAGDQQRVLRRDADRAALAAL